MIELMLFFDMIKQAMRITTPLILFIFISSLSAQKSSPYSFIVNTDHGFIDYANRIIVCRGTADIEERTQVDNSLDIVEKNIKIAIMCAEGDPLECHRLSMISVYLKEIYEITKSSLLRSLHKRF